MGDDADRLDIFLFTEAGGDHIAKPALAETARVGAHAMNDLNDDLGQFVEAVVLPLDRCGRQRFLASAAQRALRGVARFGSDRDALSAVPPGAGISDPLPSASMRGRQIFANRDLRGSIELGHVAFLRSRSVEGAGAGNASQSLTHRRLERERRTRLVLECQNRIHLPK